jgi:hypothetical protein
MISQEEAGQLPQGGGAKKGLFCNAILYENPKPGSGHKHRLRI